MSLNVPLVTFASPILVITNFKQKSTDGVHRKIYLFPFMSISFGFQSYVNIIITFSNHVVSVGRMIAEKAK